MGSFAKRSKGVGVMSAVLFGLGLAGAAWLVVSRPKQVRRSAMRMAGNGDDLTRDRKRSPEFLRASILGTDKGMVQSVFGVPRATSGMAEVPEVGRQAYWEADVWYYALDPARRTAMAIRFDQGVARGVDFVDG